MLVRLGEGEGVRAREAESRSRAGLDSDLKRSEGASSYDKEKVSGMERRGRTARRLTK